MAGARLVTWGPLPSDSTSDHSTPRFAHAGHWGGDPERVGVLFSRTTIERTSRLTVLLRVLLTIPHAVVLWLGWTASFVLAPVAWLFALVAARLPSWADRFFRWLVTYQARVTAYVLLVSDTWPALSDEAEQPVRVLIHRPDRLNRLAVLFRYFLLVPVGLLGSLLAYGFVVVAMIGWLVTLVMGRMPRPFFDATASFTRFWARYTAYLLMTTAAYPGGLFGEPGDLMFDPTASDDDRVPTPPDVSGGATALIVVSLVAGIPVLIGVSLLGSSQDDRLQRIEADNQLGSGYEALDFDFGSRCGNGPASIGCLTDAAQHNADEVLAFKYVLDGLAVPEDAVQELAMARNTTSRLANDLLRLSSASSLREYRQLYRSTGLGAAAEDFDSAVISLDEALRAGID